MNLKWADLIQSILSVIIPRIRWLFVKMKFDYSFDNPTQPSPYEYNQTIQYKSFYDVKRYNSKRRLIDWWFDGIDWSRICWLLLRSIVGILKSSYVNASISWLSSGNDIASVGKVPQDFFFLLWNFFGGGLEEILYTSKNEPLSDIVYNSLHELYTVYMIRMYFVWIICSLYDSFVVNCVDDLHAAFLYKCFF